MASGLLRFDHEDVGVRLGSAKGEFGPRFRIRARFRKNHGPFHRSFRMQRVFPRRPCVEGDHGFVGEDNAFVAVAVDVHTGLLRDLT